jgi:hypothetical protein
MSDKEIEEGEALSDEEMDLTRDEMDLTRDEIPSAGVQDSDEEGEDLMKPSKKKRFVSLFFTFHFLYKNISRISVMILMIPMKRYLNCDGGIHALLLGRG